MILRHCCHAVARDAADAAVSLSLMPFMLCNITMATPATPFRFQIPLAFRHMPTAFADIAAATPLFRRYELAMPPLISVTRRRFAAVRAAMPRRHFRLAVYAIFATPIFQLFDWPDFRGRYAFR
jgi:hypothetical protein